MHPREAQERSSLHGRFAAAGENCVGAKTTVCGPPKFRDLGFGKRLHVRFRQVRCGGKPENASGRANGHGGSVEAREQGAIQEIAFDQLGVRGCELLTKGAGNDVRCGLATCEIELGPRTAVLVDELRTQPDKRYGRWDEHHQEERAEPPRAGAPSPERLEHVVYSSTLSSGLGQASVSGPLAGEAKKAVQS